MVIFDGDTLYVDKNDIQVVGQVPKALWNGEENDKYYIYTDIIAMIDFQCKSGLLQYDYIRFLDENQLIEKYKRELRHFIELVLTMVTSTRKANEEDMEKLNLSAHNLNQLYAYINNKAEIDKEIDEMCGRSRKRI